MKDFLSRLPLPVTVLALAWVVLGNSLQGVIPFLSDLCMVITILLLLLTLMKLIFMPKTSFKSLSTPVGLSMFSTFALSLIMIAVWMKGVFDKANIYFWVTGVILEAIILVIFIVKYVLNFKLKSVFSTWYLVFVGIGMASITGSDFGMEVFGRAILKYIFVAAIVLTPFIVYRYMRVSLTSAAKPLIGIFAFPLGVIIPSYIAMGQNISTRNLWIMWICLQVIFFAIMVYLAFHLFDGYYPSNSAYGLAAAITLYATREFELYLIARKLSTGFIQYLMYFEFVLAFVICAVISVSYLMNTLEDPEKHRQKVKENKEKERKRLREKRRAHQKRLREIEISKDKKETRKNKVSTRKTDQVSNTEKEPKKSLLVDIEDAESLID